MAISDANQSDVGIIGLDVIGRNAALHLAEHDFNVAACDWGRRKTRVLREQITGPKVRVAADFSELLATLRQPRTILICGDAETPLNLVLDQLLPELKLGDLLMDAGDSYFKDTAKNHGLLAERGIQFMGIGLVGGEKGARHGAVVMAGGGREARERTRPLLKAMAATVRGEPCVSYFETAAAAHFVKLCHAGVEYALLQLLSETFALLQRTLLLTDEELHDASRAWHLGVLNGYLMEISGQVFEPEDRQTPRLVLEQRLESVRNDPLGKWVAQSARELEVQIPTIEVAVGTQRVAAAERQQALLATPFRQPVGRFGDDTWSVLDEMHAALHAAMMITYAQGMALLSAASLHLGFHFNLHEISRAWRGGTRLRTSLLDDITTALQATPDLPGLLSDDDLSQGVMTRQEKLRHAVWRAHELDAVVPALLASLDYLDANREAWLPVNLIQVQPRPPASKAVQIEWASEEYV
jgi:6-phosphogluconate dehydrogenase